MRWTPGPCSGSYSRASLDRGHACTTQLGRLKRLPSLAFPPSLTFSHLLTPNRPPQATPPSMDPLHLPRPPRRVRVVGHRQRGVQRAAIHTAFAVGASGEDAAGDQGDGIARCECGGACLLLSIHVAALDASGCSQPLHLQAFIPICVLSSHPRGRPSSDVANALLDMPLLGAHHDDQSAMDTVTAARRSNDRSGPSYCPSTYQTPSPKLTPTLVLCSEPDRGSHPRVHRPLTLPELGFTALAFCCGTLFYAFLVGETSAIAMEGMWREVQRTEVKAPTHPPTRAEGGPLFRLEPVFTLACRAHMHSSLAISPSSEVNTPSAAPPCLVVTTGMLSRGSRPKLSTRCRTHLSTRCPSHHPLATPSYRHPLTTTHRHSIHASQLQANGPPPHPTTQPTPRSPSPPPRSPPPPFLPR